MSEVSRSANSWRLVLPRLRDRFTGGWRRDVLLSFITRFGVVAVNYLALALISRTVSVTDFGVVSFVISAQLTISLIIELGLGPLLTRYASFYLGSGETGRAFNIFKAVLVTKLALNSLVALGAFTLGPLVASVFYGDGWKLALVSGVLLAVGTSFQSYFISVFQSLGRFGLVLVALLLQYGGQFLILTAIWLFGEVTVPAIIATYGLGFLLLGAAAFSFFPWRQVAAASVRAELPFWRQYRVFWQWMALSNLAVALAVPVTTLILASLYPADEVARYYSAFKLVQIFWFMEQVVDFVLLPWLSQQVGLSGADGVLSRVPRLLALVSGVGLVITLALALFAGPLIRLLYGEVYSEAAPVVYWLLPVGFGFLLYGAGNQVLISLGRPAVSAWVASGGATLNLTLNWLLTPAYGAIGAAAAGSVAMSVQMFGVWLAVRHLKNRY